MTTRTLAVLACVLAVAACAGSTAPESARTTTSAGTLVTSIVPAGGATSVDPSAPIVIHFASPMMSGMEALVMLHVGVVTGPTVTGTATWSTDHATLTFTPSAPLAHMTTYVLHLSPDLEDASGGTIDWGRCASAFGGQAVPSGTFAGAMMGGAGGMGPGMMGAGWQPGSGTWGYGMILSFRTA